LQSAFGKHCGGSSVGTFQVAVVNLSALLNVKRRVPEGNSPDAIQLWVPSAALTDGLGRGDCRAKRVE
jgi:hypothetical protein